MRIRFTKSFFIYSSIQHLVYGRVLDHNPNGSQSLVSSFEQSTGEMLPALSSELISRSL